MSEAVTRADRLEDRNALVAAILIEEIANGGDVFDPAFFGKLLFEKQSYWRRLAEIAVVDEPDSDTICEVVEWFKRVSRKTRECVR